MAAWAAIIWSGLDTSSTNADVARQAARDIVASVIWTLYMLKSRRVKATFVKRYRKREPLIEDLVPAAA